MSAHNPLDRMLHDQFRKLDRRLVRESLPKDMQDADAEMAKSPEAEAIRAMERGEHAPKDELLDGDHGGEHAANVTRRSMRPADIARERNNARRKAGRGRGGHTDSGESGE